MGYLTTKHNRWRLRARQDRARIDAFETEIEHLKAERNALEAENTTLKMDNIESKEVNEYLRDKVKKLKGALPEIEKLKVEIEELKNILKIFDDDGSIGDDLDTLRFICVDANHAYEQSSILVEKTERLYEQIAKLKAQATETPDNERTSAIVTENSVLKTIIEKAAVRVERIREIWAPSCLRNVGGAICHCMGCQLLKMLKQEADSDNS